MMLRGGVGRGERERWERAVETRSTPYGDVGLIRGLSIYEAEWYTSKNK